MATDVLDHIVHLTPPGTVEQAASEFRKLGFDVIPGGTHADGLTANALVVLADGVYLELIAFVHPGAPPASHRWGRTAPGWIDFAHLGLSADVSSVINARAAQDGSGVEYCVAVDGGRETPGGERLEWRLTAPGAEHGVGRLPFFCEDVTPRDRRVPAAGKHPCTAQGVSHVKLRAPGSAAFETAKAQLSTVVGRGPTPAADGRSVAWRLQTPRAGAELHTTLVLVLEDAAAGVDARAGICEVGFWVREGPGGEVESPYGRIVMTPMPAGGDVRGV
ncbi:glyoxalase-like domain-containing protein [Gautieria morchelliformis]|nr:glyoxalase-like domain-containing protein [Gautieria morchelliformis]